MTDDFIRNLNLGCAVFNTVMFIWLGSPISLLVGLANGFTYSILSQISGADHG